MEQEDSYKVVGFTEVGKELYVRMEVLDELEQELARLYRWQEELRASGKPGEAEDLEHRIAEVEDAIADLGGE